MTKGGFAGRIVMLEMLGFAVIFIFLWLSEILDLPHLVFGAPATPVNIVESAMTSVMVLVLAVAVVMTTYRLIQTVSSLEMLFTICPQCKRVHVDEEWISLEDYMTVHSRAMFSRHLCPRCAQEYSRESSSGSHDGGCGGFSVA